MDKILGLARAGRVALETYDSRRSTTEEGKKEGKKREEGEKTKTEEKEVEKGGKETEGREVDRAKKDRAETDEKKKKTKAEAEGGMEKKEEEEKEDTLPTVYSVVAKAGDVVIMHPWNVHCGTTNLRATPRFMANGMVRMTREAFEARWEGDKECVCVCVCDLTRA